MESKAIVFDKLRCAIRIALPDGKKGINDNGDSMDMKTIEEKVTAFRKWLLENKHRKIGPGSIDPIFMKKRLIGVAVYI